MKNKIVHKDSAEAAIKEAQTIRAVIDYMLLIGTIKDDAEFFTKYHGVFEMFTTGAIEYSNKTADQMVEDCRKRLQKVLDNPPPDEAE